MTYVITLLIPDGKLTADPTDYAENTVHNALMRADIVEHVLKSSDGKGATKNVVTVILEAYVDREHIIKALTDTEAYTLLSVMTAEDKAPKTDPLQLYEVCYHEILARTIYVYAKDEYEARELAERHFENEPLRLDELADRDMNIDTANPAYVSDDDILYHEDWEGFV